MGLFGCLGLENRIVHFSVVTVFRAPLSAGLSCSLRDRGDRVREGNNDAVVALRLLTDGVYLARGERREAGLANTGGALSFWGQVGRFSAG